MTSEASGYISAHELYTLEEFGSRLGLGTAALRSARRRGLRIGRVGRRSYVLGSDFIAYIHASAACYNKASRPSATNT